MINDKIHERSLYVQNRRKIITKRIHFTFASFYYEKYRSLLPKFNELQKEAIVMSN